MPDLNPCPFCGSGDVAYEEFRNPFEGRGSNSTHYVVHCWHCGALIQGCSYTDVVNKWNTRAVSADPVVMWDSIKKHADDYTIFGYTLKGLFLIADAMQRLNIPTSDIKQYIKDEERIYENVMRAIASIPFPLNVTEESSESYESVFAPEGK